MTEVEFIRDYDRYREGDVETFTDAVAEALCNDANDGEGPFAAPVSQPDTRGGQGESGDGKEQH